MGTVKSRVVTAQTWGLGSRGRKRAWDHGQVNIGRTIYHAAGLFHMLRGAAGCLEVPGSTQLPGA